jgi:hypothetical protein
MTPPGAVVGDWGVAKGFATPYECVAGFGIALKNDWAVKKFGKITKTEIINKAMIFSFIMCVVFKVL